jgi:hypothetical protein
VHRDPADVIVAQLYLPGVQPGSDRDADPGQFRLEGSRAVNRPAGAVEGGQDPVSRRLDHAPPALDHAST